MKAEQTDSAILLFKKYLRLEPQSLDAHLGLAAAYEQMGFTEKAIKAYQQVLSLEPNRSDVRKQLSRLMR
jgi:Tfp pilus assembly protein PilF